VQARRKNISVLAIHLPNISDTQRASLWFGKPEKRFSLL